MRQLQNHQLQQYELQQKNLVAQALNNEKEQLEQLLASKTIRWFSSWFKDKINMWETRILCIEIELSQKKADEHVKEQRIINYLTAEKDYCLKSSKSFFRTKSMKEKMLFEAGRIEEFLINFPKKSTHEKRMRDYGKFLQSRI
jgi:hypothetical protein